MLPHRSGKRSKKHGVGNLLCRTLSFECLESRQLLSIVAPYLTISGNQAVNQGSQYTLNLSASGTGADTISSWEINWNDGDVQSVSGNPSSVTHTYADGLNHYGITATATNEDGTFPAVGNNSQLDTSFGTDGKTMTELSADSLGMIASATGADGTTVALTGNVDGSYSLTRFQSDGQIDTDFGANGVVTTDLCGMNNPSAIAIQSDGRIVVVGSDNSDFCLVRSRPMARWTRVSARMEK